MEKLNKNTQKAKQFIENYKRAKNNGNLFDVYKNNSCKKYLAIMRCKDICQAYNGKNPKITSYNTFVFTYAFIVENDIQKQLVYITPNNEYIIEL